VIWEIPSLPITDRNLRELILLIRLENTFN
jgi:hypothetical protein